jgi:hypothetical protein
MNGEETLAFILLSKWLAQLDEPLYSAPALRRGKPLSTHAPLSSNSRNGKNARGYWAMFLRQQDE